ncbi:MAG: peptidase M75, partial [Frankiales bacterium]|nr:peptidase M75 [Frankiales bacterium]
MRRTVPVALLALALAGCGGQAASTASSADAVRVSASDTACAVSRTSLPAGATVFRIENT